LDIPSPVFFIKINGQKRTGIVSKKRIYSKYMLTAQMFLYSFCIVRGVIGMGALGALYFGLSTNAGFPFIFAHGTIADFALFTAPLPSKYI